MASSVPSMQELIDADRAKRKAEKLAAEIFGRKAPTPTGRGRKGQGNAASGSLASRVGVNKRSASAASRLSSNIDGPWTHDLHDESSPVSLPKSKTNPPRTFATNVERKYYLYNKLARELSANEALSPLNPRTASTASMSIRGMASKGPYVVIASNLAPNTSAEDVQAAMEPVGGTVQSCVLISTTPTVMAEIVFEDKDGAENVIATFNNQKADGRVLYVYMKAGGPTPHLHPLHNSRLAPARTPSVPPPAPEPPKDHYRIPSPPIAPAPQAPLSNQQYSTAAYSNQASERSFPRDRDRDRGREGDVMEVDTAPERMEDRLPRVQNRAAATGYGNGYQGRRDDYNRGRWDRRDGGGGGGGGGMNGRGLYSDQIAGARYR